LEVKRRWQRREFFGLWAGSDEKRRGVKTRVQCGPKLAVKQAN